MLARDFYSDVYSVFHIFQSSLRIKGVISLQSCLLERNEISGIFMNLHITTIPLFLIFFSPNFYYENARGDVF